MSEAFSIQLYDKELFAQMKRAREAAIDLRPVFRLIQESWHKGNRAIFSLQSPGKYVDLMPSTKKIKLKKYNRIYPILKASGKMESTMIAPGDPANFIGKTFAQFGTSAPYAKFLHNGTKNMAARPVVLLGPEQVAPDALKTRAEKWVELMSNYISDSLKGPNV